MTDDDRALLTKYLTDENFTALEIENAISKLQSHDWRVNRESVFDSIESGSFNIKAIIEEAKNES